jgi:hypothetical protein
MSLFSFARLPLTANGRLPRGLGLVLLGLPALGGCAPDSPASSSSPAAVVALSSPELARGEYLVRHVALCETCHSQRDWSFYSGPLVPGTERQGGMVELFGSTAQAPDISGPALAAWTVDGLAESLRRKERRDGTPLHRDPMLAGFAALTESDGRAIAGFLKAPATDLERDVGPLPSTADHLGVESAAAGGYLVTIGRCATCHGEDLSGGQEIALPSGPSMPSANLTLDASGIGRMDRQEFIDYVKSLDAPELQRIEVPAGELNTAMPWPWLSGMSRDDLGSIYDYLGTVEPVTTTPR